MVYGGFNASGGLQPSEYSWIHDRSWMFDNIFMNTMAKHTLLLNCIIVITSNLCPKSSQTCPSMWTMKTGLSVGEVKTLGSTSECPIIPCALTVNQRFEPESRHNNGLKEEGRKKTVTFAGSPMVASPSADSLGSALR